jgi:hypothetical protein
MRGVQREQRHDGIGHRFSCDELRLVEGDFELYVSPERPSHLTSMVKLCVRSDNVPQRVCDPRSVECATQSAISEQFGKDLSDDSRLQGTALRPRPSFAEGR